jgi:GH25 family lysozyme M1 (1,4-beta-N-acetylmuramidase)
MKKGIDVSFAQGKVDWSKVKADFAIIRAGYGRGVHRCLQTGRDINVLRKCKCF